LIKQLKHPDRRLQEQAQNLDRLDIRMRRAMRESIGSQKAELTQLRRSLLASSPGQKLQHSQLQLSNSLKRLKQAIQALSAARQSSLGVLSRSLNAVSPLNTLARGYSITYDESEKVIRNSDEVKVGSKIISKLDKGRITSTIESVTSDEP